VLLFATLVLVGRRAELGAWYYGGLGLAVLLALYQQQLIRTRERERCFRAFRNNAWFGGCIFVGTLLDYVFRA
jgi:4-hydroxybenzoate polyprenyltransferase